MRRVKRRLRTHFIEGRYSHANSSQAYQTRCSALNGARERSEPLAGLRAQRMGADHLAAAEEERRCEGTPAIGICTK